MSASSRYIVGCMTGTSLDAIDTALVRIDDHGLATQATFVRGATMSLGTLREPLRLLAQQEPAAASAIATLARDFSLLHVEAVKQLLSQAAKSATNKPLDVEPDLISVHGQTVFHSPPVSWQLFEPWPLAQALNIPIVYNLRQADLAAGGQGAPITPLADVILYGNAEETSCVINLGGFINFTCIPKYTPQAQAGEHASTDKSEQHRSTNSINSIRSFQSTNLRGADVCACNQLLDGVARVVLRETYDMDGNAASTGSVHEDSLEDVEGVLRAQSHSKRSLGTGDEMNDWISRWRHRVSGADLARTACEAIAATLAERIRSLEHQPTKLILAGGGVHNRALVNAIRANCTAEVVTSDALGIPSVFREAACFAVLGALAQDGVPITLPRVTKRQGTHTGKDGVWVFP